MTKRKNDEIEIKEEPAVTEVVENKKKPKKQKKEEPENKDLRSDLELIFNIIMTLITLKNSSVDQKTFTKLYDKDNNNGYLIQVFDLAEKHKVQNNYNLQTFLSNYKPELLGYVNDSLKIHIIPIAQQIFDTVLDAMPKHQLNKSFVKIIEENMDVISDNYKGEPADFSEKTITFLKLLIAIYEKAWYKTYIKESNYISSKNYVVGVSNRIHAFYWHIKPSI